MSITSIRGLEVGCRSFLDPGLYFRHVQHTLVMPIYQRKFLEYLIEVWCWFAFIFLLFHQQTQVVKKFNERNVGVAELEKRRKEK